MLNRLLPEHEALLETLIEAHRALPHDQRVQFMMLRFIGTDQIRHTGLPGGHLDVFIGDVEGLAREGMIAVSHVSRQSQTFDVTRHGFGYYDSMKTLAKEPIEQVESDLISYLDSDRFAKKHQAAFEKWSQAAEHLWSSDSAEDFTAIGHYCRESMQAFVSDLVNQYKPEDAPADQQKTVARFRAVLAVVKPKLSDTELPFLDALLAYWGTVQDLIQRQEHGATREKGQLVWEDARRVVFQTALTMYEIDRNLSRLK